MPRGRPERRELSAFFGGLRESVLAAWTAPQGYAYDRLIYQVRYPYAKEDPRRVLRFVGHEDEADALPKLSTLNRQLVGSRYPDLAGEAPAGVSAEAWSALLHFLDPSYPLATPRANAALQELGYPLAAAITPKTYPAYVAALDELKEKAPVWAVPETNWYLARILEVGLAAYAPGRTAATRAATAAHA